MVVQGVPPQKQLEDCARKLPAAPGASMVRHPIPEIARGDHCTGHSTLSCIVTPVNWPCGLQSDPTVPLSADWSCNNPQGCDKQWYTFDMLSGLQPTHDSHACIRVIGRIPFSTVPCMESGSLCTGSEAQHCHTARQHGVGRGVCATLLHTLSHMRAGSVSALLLPCLCMTLHKTTQGI